ncbi:MAG: protein kinase, partial [Coxiellaceae bacterium]|nr:protein kinase [Coxiellaceae bacterium]
MSVEQTEVYQYPLIQDLIDDLHGTVVDCLNHVFFNDQDFVKVNADNVYERYQAIKASYHATQNDDHRGIIASLQLRLSRVVFNTSHSVTPKQPIAFDTLDYCLEQATKLMALQKHLESKTARLQIHKLIYTKIQCLKIITEILTTLKQTMDWSDDVHQTMHHLLQFIISKYSVDDFNNAFFKPATVDKKNIVYQKKPIGKGSQANILKGTYNGQDVAIKVPKRKDFENNQKQLYIEATLLQQLQHPNIIKSYGLVNDALLLEFAHWGDLEAVIIDKLFRLPRTRLCQFSLDAAKALAYVH